MALRVLAFARLRELLGFGERALEVAPSATLEDVWAAVTARRPRPRACAPRRASRATASSWTARPASLDGDEIALLPPVGGG